MKSLSARGSIHLNRRFGGKFPHLTICGEAWILDRKVRIALLDTLMFLLFLERNHCRNQYRTYGLNQRNHPHETDEDH